LYLSERGTPRKGAQGEWSHKLETVLDKILAYSDNHRRQFQAAALAMAAAIAFADWRITPNVSLGSPVPNSYSSGFRGEFHSPDTGRGGAIVHRLL
jgi:hypothetical protein